MSKIDDYDYEYSVIDQDVPVKNKIAKRNARKNRINLKREWLYE